MTSLKDKEILLVGAGPMAISHAQLLQGMNLNFTVVGRGEQSAKLFQDETNIHVVTGGIEKWLSENSKYPEYAIIAVSGTQLGNVTRTIIEHGIKNILLEKPGGLDNEDIKSVAEKAGKFTANVLLGYNRRFYASVLKAKKIIEEDGGVKSFYFEFTEWPHTIVPLKKDPEVKKRWVLHNSTHIIDLAFYLGGEPEEIHSYSKGRFDWHPNGTIFTGAGLSKSGALFSYHSNWDAPGRWGVEILTQKSRLIFRPLEKLKIQKLKSVAIEEVNIDDQLDIKFKPGLYRQLKAFLKHNTNNFINIHKHATRLEIIDKIRFGGKFSENS
ncbi:MAG: Gfo/Idh/MocA family oxidoreductase [Candidatus Lokiarchaeia archaeon]